MATQAAATQSLITFQNSQGADCRGSLLKLTRSNLVMEVYNPYSVVQLSEVLNDLCVRRGDQIIYKGRAVVSNLMNTGLMLVVSATLIEPWKDLSGIFNDPQGIRNEVRQFLADYNPPSQLSSRLRLAVVETRSFLSELSRWLEQVDVVDDLNESDDASLQMRELTHELSQQFLPNIIELYEQLEQAASSIPEDEVILHKAFVQQNLHPLLMRSPFLYRTFHKPLGYAGDYEMINMILRGGVEGPTIYTRIINMFFTHAPMSLSVCNRTDTLLQYLIQEAKRVTAQGRPLRVLSIACGPAIEVQRFIRTQSLAEQCQFKLLDFEHEALNYAKGKIEEIMVESGRQVNVEYVHESVDFMLKRLAKGAHTDSSEAHDLVYCSGLFDYFSDKICSRLLKLFYSWTKPGGMVYVTNMHPRNPNRVMLEYMMEWYLIYRIEEQMANLAPGLGKQRLFTDATGVNLGLEIRKPE